jgi:hypothetical protein
MGLTPAPDRKHAVSLMRLKRAQCRFIVSAPEQKPMFCGEATNGSSWCAWHRSIVYRPSVISPSMNDGGSQAAKSNGRVAGPIIRTWSAMSVTEIGPVTLATSMMPP